MTFQVVQKFISLLFADDTTFQISSNNFEELFQVANSELQKAAVWFQTNKLTRNISKTKYILFMPAKTKISTQNLKLEIGGAVNKFTKFRTSVR